LIVDALSNSRRGAMMQLEKNLERIQALSVPMEKENIRFRMFLKGLDSGRVDHVVHRINKDVEREIDCTECGNCCATLRPVVTERDIAKLSEKKNVSRESFLERYTVHDKFENTYSLKHTPCVFLVDKKCSVYDERPHDCRSFPHIEKDGFTSRTLEMMSNYEVCPLVFNALERLKKELQFR
jgi:Fe-S-cluster containining protein